MSDRAFGIFGDLRDPMTETEEEIEADIQQREAEDRRERAPEPHRLQRHAAWIETIKHKEQQKLLRRLLNRGKP